MRIGVLLALCLALAGLCAHAQVNVIDAAEPKLGSYLLVLGDGYAAGNTLPTIGADPQCKAPDAPGFACVLYRYLQHTNPRLQLENLAEDFSDSCQYAGAGHHCYDLVPRANPLDAAVRFLGDHAGQVSPITVTIGGNDLLPLLPKALNDPATTAKQLPAVLGRYRSNLDVILEKLRTAAGPEATIVVTTQINPLGGIGSPPLPPGVPELAKSALGLIAGIQKSEAPKYDAVVADTSAAFDAHPGGAALLTYAATSLASGDPEKLVPYPTPDGYRVFAGTVITAAGYLIPLKLLLSVKKKTVHPGRAERVTGTVTAGATVRISVTLPGRHAKTVMPVIPDSGNFSVNIKVGKTRGKGSVQACALDIAGKSACTKRLQFTVR